MFQSTPFVAALTSSLSVDGDLCFFYSTSGGSCLALCFHGSSLTKKTLCCKYGYLNPKSLHSYRIAAFQRHQTVQTWLCQKTVVSSKRPFGGFSETSQACPCKGGPSGGDVHHERESLSCVGGATTKTTRLVQSLSRMAPLYVA